jgi:hypothetical protein
VLVHDALESPLARTPDDPGFRSEPAVAISVHDGSRLQWSATLPLCGGDYVLAATLEIPAELDATCRGRGVFSHAREERREIVPEADAFPARRSHHLPARRHVAAIRGRLQLASGP